MRFLGVLDGVLDVRYDVRLRMVSGLSRLDDCLAYNPPLQHHDEPHDTSAPSKFHL